jgi:peptidoglycan/LPS O-acetylase OafA/YrhL
LGAVSYPLYIVHQNIGYVIIRSLEGSAVAGNIAVGLAIAAALGLAFLITKYIDRPAQQHLRPLLKEITFDSISTWNVRDRTAVLTSTDHQSLQSNALNQAGNRES